MVSELWLFSLNSLRKTGRRRSFSRKFKQFFPQFPKKIGVVTSPSGAVIRDIITTVGRRFQEWRLFFIRQECRGDEAAAQIADHIRLANEVNLDVLIIGRGGSIEDLWAFNEEETVRAIFESRIPVISSVGHETDTTLADFVADRRGRDSTYRG